MRGALTFIGTFFWTQRSSKCGPQIHLEILDNGLSLQNHENEKPLWYSTPSLYVLGKIQIHYTLAFLGATDSRESSYIWSIFGYLPYSLTNVCSLSVGPLEINPCHGEFNLGNTKIYFHFLAVFSTGMVQVVEFLQPLYHPYRNYSSVHILHIYEDFSP